MSIGPGDATVRDVTDDGDFVTFEALLVLSYRQGIEQRLSRMFVSAVARIDDARFCQACDSKRRARRTVTDNHAICGHRVQRLCSVDERLSFGDAAVRSRYV